MRRSWFAGAAIALAGAVGAQAQTASSGAVGGLTVVAGAQPKQTRIDRTVYAVAHDLQSTTGTAADVLANVPSVAVDVDGAISLRGDPNVTILVDGKPSAEFSGAAKGLSLLQFPASEIDRIEVLTNPPAEYKAEGSAGVINIVTKKRRQPGASGGGQFMIGDKRRYLLSLDGAYNAGPLKLSVVAGLRQDAKERITTDVRSALDQASGVFQPSGQTVDERFRRLIPSIKGGAEYDVSDKQSLTASYSHRELTGHRYFDQNDEDGLPGAFTSQSLRHSDGREWATDTSESLRLDQGLWRPGETLSLSLQRSASGEREGYAYANTYYLPAAPQSFDTLHLGLDLTKTEIGADYTLPLAGDRQLKLGYDLEDDRNAYDHEGHTIDPVTGVPTIDPTITDHFRYRQQVNAGYGQYEAPMGPWRLQAGLRLEAAAISMLQITGNIPGERHESGAYPTLHLDRALGDALKLSFAVGRRITRPDPEALNPFLDTQDTHNLRAGNPNLAPQDTWTYEAGFNHSKGAFSYGATAYYRFDRDSVTDVVQPVSSDVVLATKANLPKSQAAGVEFSLNGKLTSRLTYSLSGDSFYAQIDAAGLGGAGLRSTTGVNLKASLDAKLTGVDTAQVSVTRQDRRLTPQGYVDAIDQVNAGYRRQLRPDLALVVTVTDLFDGQRTERIVQTSTLRDDYVRHQLGRVALVGLSYTFGAGRKAKSSGFQYDQ